MRLTMSMKWWFGILAVTLVALPGTVRAQDLVSQALKGFPTDTIRLEFSSPAKLRSLPNYASLRQRYVGPKLRQLIDSLGQVGVSEDDISGLVLGWQPGSTEMTLYGYATGHFSARTLADTAAQRSITPTQVEGKQAYCLEGGLAGTCVVVLGDTVGAFGSLTALTAMLDTLDNQTPSLGSDSRMSSLVSAAAKDASIWGVAVGPAVADWFRGWMPNQGSVKLDWDKVFADVSALTYSVTAGQDVTLSLKMNCKSSQSAASLRQVLEGLKLAQQLAWDYQNPGKENPYKAMNTGLDGDQVSLNLTTGYAELELASSPAGATN
jgi:hypothetical protein